MFTTRFILDHTCKAAAYCAFGFGNDAVYELRAGRHVIDEASHLACGPNATVGVAVLFRVSPALPRNERSHVLELDGVAFRTLDGLDFRRDGVSEDACGVVQSTEHEYGVRFLALHESLFKRLWPRAFFRCTKTCSAIYAVSPQG